MSDWLFLAGYMVCGILVARAVWLTVAERDLPGLPMLGVVIMWPFVVIIGAFFLVVALIYFLVTWKNPFGCDENDRANSA